MSYEQRLTDIGIILLEPFKGTKTHHLMKCNNCSHEWSATPISKTQAFKKYGYNGCPECNKIRIQERNNTTRHQNIQVLLDKGFIILSDWDGRNAIGKDCMPLPVTVQNINCGHVFTSTAVNLLRRDITCPICAIDLRTHLLNKSSKERSDEWRKTATPWRAYKAKVSNITKISYRQNKHIINPNNIKFGRAGQNGAYHLDHIVPVRYCFENNIPEELCGHPDNLQVLEWKENISCRDKLKNNIPEIFVDFL